MCLCLRESKGGGGGKSICYNSYDLLDTNLENIGLLFKGQLYTPDKQRACMFGTNEFCLSSR